MSTTMYLDTVSIFSHKVKVDLAVLKSEKWQYTPHSQHPNLSYWRKDVSTPNGSTTICLKYFHSIWRKSLLMIQFNARKLLNNSNNNSDPVILQDKNTLYERISDLIDTSVGIKLTSSSLAQFKVRRADIAHNHLVSEYQIDDLLKLLDTLILPRFNKIAVNSTRYYNSRKTRYANSGIVIKFYNKTDEMLSKGFPEEQAFSFIVDTDHQHLIEITDDGYLITYINAHKYYKLRFEGAFKVAKLNAFFKQHRLSNTFDNLLDESVQLALLNDYFLKLHLDVPFYNKKHVHHEIDRQFSKKAINNKMKAIADALTNDKKKDLYRLINSTKPELWLRKKVNVLYDNGNGCHLAYAPQINLSPITLPFASASILNKAVITPSDPSVKPQVSMDIINIEPKAND